MRMVARVSLRPAWRCAGAVGLGRTINEGHKRERHDGRLCIAMRQGPEAVGRQLGESAACAVAIEAQHARRSMLRPAMAMPQVRAVKDRNGPWGSLVACLKVEKYPEKKALSTTLVA